MIFPSITEYRDALRFEGALKNYANGELVTMYLFELKKMKTNKKYLTHKFHCFPKPAKNRKSCLLPENVELYRKWREIQRIQLGISANLYLIFASAVLGFDLKFLIEEKDYINLLFKVPLTISIILLVISHFYYARLTHNRLIDFRLTSYWLKKGKTEFEVARLTRKKGEITWKYYNYQRCTLIIGFLISLVFFGVYIYF